MRYIAALDRYDQAQYRLCGNSGLKLPVLSLGLWYSFGDDFTLEVQRKILHRAFDLGITHFDLANKYGRPDGSAEDSFGRLLRRDLATHRDELIISTKAGYPIWPGPYGGGGTRKHLLASLDQSLQRLGTEYVDIFYSHCPDPATPLDETASALSSAVKQGKALYLGLSSYTPEDTRRVSELLAEMDTSLLVHQPPYSMLNRDIEGSLLEVVGELNIGCVAFSPLSQGILTGKYSDGVPAGSRAAQGRSLTLDNISTVTLAQVEALRDIAARRGQSLTQMALAWALRDDRVTSLLMGVSSVEQLEENYAAQNQLKFSEAELKEIDCCLDREIKPG